MSSMTPLSFKVNATISAYRAVTMLTGTANTVKVPANATECPVGITLDTVLDTTTAIPVAPIGAIAKLFFNDTVTSGALVALDNAGRGVPHTSTTAGSYVIGQLVGTEPAATGSVQDVFINPMFISIP